MFWIVALIAAAAPNVQDTRPAKSKLTKPQLAELATMSGGDAKISGSGAKCAVAITAGKKTVKEEGGCDFESVKGALLRASAAIADEMVAVPAGAFFRGCNEEVDKECDPDEKPGKKIELPAFEIDKNEVSVEAFARCVKAGACSAKDAEVPFWDGATQPGAAMYCNWATNGREKHPMNCIDFEQANKYCAWVKKRLPNELEWEKAARGTDARKYPWGNQEYGKYGIVANIADETAKAVYPQTVIANGYDDGVVATAPVGSFPRGVSPYGALDMIGNVLEWCSDAYGGGEAYAVRGGSWTKTPKASRASHRDAVPPTGRGEDLGFRCAR